ncbi:hypothetical protein A5N78_20605 [Prescottella equi]|uniref:phage tail tape measure protein n=1 Tax=Rhodococcus hoagii TaxID=43767 RepID=UPI000A216844|nr:phage tail tape measure protein [Prescottella equi]ORL86109.1 hypothetical protein A5N78_20605 [Prescottella equi]ORM13205.1 hypothetical protein A5N70_20955 [Prescottella equi]
MLNVGELVARLTLDDSGFTRGVQNAQQQSQRLNQQLGTIGTSAQQASQQLGRIELNRGLDRMAEQAARQVQELAQRSQDATRSAAQIAIDDSLLRDARQAANQIEELRNAAQQAGDQVGQLGNELGDVAGGAGNAGEQAGGNFLSGFSDAIGGLASKTGPIAGSILGVAALGVAAGAGLAAAIMDGLDQELSRDLFQAQTRTTEAQARKFALAAGEAYADAFGESVEANLSTLKLALQNKIIDPGTTQRDAQKVVADLESISAALDGEVAISVKAVSALMSTGLATSAQEASDMIANAVGGSANKGEDLLEVIWEYSAGWKNAGISAEGALAMIEQATDNGAWNADAPGDALREFGRRITEEGETIVETLNDIGLNGEEMYEAFQKGGDEGFEALDMFFDKIRGMEDPVKRNAAIMGLLGDTSGDFVDVFAKWDPSEALKNFGEFEGAASDLAGTLGGNAATSVKGAMNSVSTVASGLKGVAAEAFGPYIKEFADSISNNRAGVIDFFLNVADVAFDGAEAVLGFVSGGIRGLGEFAGAGSEMAASVLGSIADLVRGLDSFMGPFDELIPGLPSFGKIANDIDDFANSAKEAGVGADGNGGIKGVMNGAADAIENRLIPAVGTARGKVAEWGGDLRDSAAYNDEIAKVAKSIDQVGIAADGSAMDLETFIGVHDDRRIPELDASIRSLVGGLEAQTRAGLDAGKSIEELTSLYGSNRDALIEQLMSLGMSNDMAVQYINSLGMTPELIDTQIHQSGMPEAHYALDVLNDKVIGVPDEKTVHTYALTDDAVADLEALGLKVERLPDGTVMVTANTSQGETIIGDFIKRNDGKSMTVYVDPVVRSQRYQDNLNTDIANGGFVHYAAGGIEDHQAQIGNGRTRIWNEPETGGESYIPLAPSKRARSEAILRETARRFGLGVVRFGRDQLSEIFMGDPKSLTNRTDPTGWRALLGGDFNGKLSRFGIEEDSPLATAVLSARKAIVDGDFDGQLSKFGIEEDSPIARALLGLNRNVVRFANGGIFDGDAAVAKAKAHNGEGYVYGGLDCSGYLSEVFNAGTGQSVRFVTGSDFEAMGWEPGYDPNGFSIGTDKGVGENGHMAGSLFGVNIESDGSNGIQYGGSADGPLDFPYVYHWPGASRPSYDRGQLDSEITKALAEESSAATPEARERAAQRRQTLEAQRDGVSGVTDSGVGLATDGQRVFVTNWPSGLGASLPARSGGSSPSSGVSYSGGGGTLSTAREAAGDGEEATLTPRPITDYLNPEDMFWQFAEGMGISKPGGVVGALMDAGKEPENVKALEQIAETLRVIAEDPPTQVVFQVKDIDEGIRQWNTYINGKSLSWTK